MGVRKRVAREAQKVIEEIYADDLYKANAASGIVGDLFRKIGTGQIDETDISKAATEVETQLKTNFPEAWEGGVNCAFREFFGG